MTARVAAALLLLICVPAGLAASEEQAPAESGGSGLVGKVINFVILFGGLFILLRKPIGALLIRRTADIERALAESADARLSAERMLDEARRKAAALEAETARLKAEAEAEGRREKDRIRALAESEAERLRTLARQEIEAYLKSGLRDLRGYAAELAASLAEASLKKRLTKADQAALVDQSIAKLKTLNEKPDAR